MPGGDRPSPACLPSIDALTGVYDRATLLSMLFRETDRAQRMKTPLCLLLIGVDAPRDSYACPVGEAVEDFLRGVANRIMRQLRSYDSLGRMGDNDLLAVLPGCRPADASTLAERCRRNVFEPQFTVADSSVQLIAYFGIASSEGRSPIVVLREAEQALQRARVEGPASIYCCRPGQDALEDGAG